MAFSSTKTQLPMAPNYTNQWKLPRQFESENYKQIKTKAQRSIKALREWLLDLGKRGGGSTATLETDCAATLQRKQNFHVQVQLDLCQWQAVAK